MSLRKGFFVTFEGGEGAGKSTQVKLLSEYFSDIGLDIVVTREPGGTKISEQIREILLNIENSEMAYETEALLYAAARAQHVKELIVPALKEGKIVICDRFLDSSVVYQGCSRNLSEKLIIELNAPAVGGIVPDVTIFLDVPPSQGLERKIGTEPDRLEKAGEEFHKNIYLAYKTLAAANPGRIHAIDGTKSAEKVFEDVRNVVNNYIKE